MAEDPSANAPRESTARPAVASMRMTGAEQQRIRCLFALLRREMSGRRLTALVVQLNGDLRFHYADGDGAASSSPPARGRPGKPGSPHSVRSPTTSTAVRTSTSTSTVSRKEHKRRCWQFRAICNRIAARRFAFCKWKAAMADAMDDEAPPATPPDAEMESTSITDTLSEALPPTTTEATTETASTSTDTLSVAPSTPKTYARAATAQTSPSTGSAHSPPTTTQKRPVAASTPGSTTSPHPSPSRSANKKKKPTPPSPAKKGLRGSSKQPG